jgi:hypothetical protein
METRLGHSLGHSDDLMPKIPKTDCLDLTQVTECQKVPATRSERTAIMIRGHRADPNRRMLIAFTVASGMLLATTRTAAAEFRRQSSIGNINPTSARRTAGDARGGMRSRVAVGRSQPTADNSGY